MSRLVPAISTGASLGLLLASAAFAEAPCLNAMQPGCRFTISGKDGPFIRHVDPKALAARDAAAATGGGAGRDLADHSINRGEFSQTALALPQTKARLDALIAKLRAQWPNGEVGPIKVYIVGSTAYGARAQPDRSIVVPMGLLMNAKSDDEVAWVLGHEFSHLALRHYADSAAVQARKRELETSVALTQIGFDVADRMRRIGATLHIATLPAPAAALSENAAWARGQELRQTLLLGDALATREQEDEADASGFDLATAAGFDADSGSIAALKFAAEDEKRLAARAASTTQQMQTAARQSVDRKSAGALATGGVMGATLQVGRRLGEKTMHWVTTTVTGYLSRSHRPVTIRIKGLSAYAQAAYPPAGPPPAKGSTAWLAALRAAPEFAAARQAVIARDTALVQMQGGDPTAALATLQPQMATRLGATLLILNVAARAQQGLGRPAQADALYDRAEAAGQSLEGYNDHVVMLVASGDLAKARTRIAQAERRFGDHERFLPSIIAMAVRQHDKGKISATVSECMGLQNEVLRLECHDALYDDRQHRQLDDLQPEERAKVEAQLDRSAGEMTRGEMVRRAAGGNP